MSSEFEETTEKVRLLSPKPGDMLVVTLGSRYISHSEHEQLRDSIKTWLEENNYGEVNVFIITSDMKVQLLSPQPADTVVMSVESDVEQVAMDDLLDSLKDWLKKHEYSSHALVLRNNQKLEAISEDEMAEKGWMRKENQRGYRYL